MANPTSTRCVEISDEPPSVPRSTSSTAASRTLPGDGSWTEVNQPSEVETCHRTSSARGRLAPMTTRPHRRGGDGATRSPDGGRRCAADRPGRGAGRDDAIDAGAGHSKRLGSALRDERGVDQRAERGVDRPAGLDVARGDEDRADLRQDRDLRGAGDRVDPEVGPLGDDLGRDRGSRPASLARMAAVSSGCACAQARACS